MNTKYLMLLIISSCLIGFSCKKSSSSSTTSTNTNTNQGGATTPTVTVGLNWTSSTSLVTSNCTYSVNGIAAGGHLVSSEPTGTPATQLEVIITANVGQTIVVNYPTPIALNIQEISPLLPNEVQNGVVIGPKSGGNGEIIILQSSVSTLSLTLQ
jgi:hypothetical protein